MRSDEVSAWQAQKISSWLTPTLVRLVKLHARMVVNDFSDSDPLMAKVVAAKEAVRELQVQLHDLEAKRQRSEEAPTWLKARGVD